MERFIKGDVVVIPFPFTNLTETKKRPAFVVTNLQGNDIIICPITSQLNKDNYSILITSSDMKTGELNKISNARPNVIFTADRNLIKYKIGKLTQTKTTEIINKIIEIIKS
ncbi:MAG: type II toxin-antitoxin system PemK/MazF family toxin [Elusimicrobiota bacterium]